MKLYDRVLRHARITKHCFETLPSPPFLVLFVNSVCNMKCEHCFFWRSLNNRNDLTTEEILQLSRSLGRIENLSLSGGEPFIRRELGEICRQFIRHNQVRQIYVPTNGWFTEQTVQQASIALEEKGLDLFVAELSLDGMQHFHDNFRGTQGAFEKAMNTYDALAELQRREPRLRIHASSTANNTNTGEIRELTRYLFDRCPRIDHHNLAIIQGDRRDPSLLMPDLQEYQELYRYMRSLWAPRETGRYGAIVEPMLQWAKTETIKRKTQLIPCTAGRLTAVVYANGDISVCELHKPIGNLRQQPFWEIWGSGAARDVRKSIARKECNCGKVVFLWPSIVYQPRSLVQAMVGARVWQKPKPVEVGSSHSGAGEASSDGASADKA